MGKQKTKSPQSQLSKTDTYEINQTFSFLQSDAYIEFADTHPEVQITSSEIARRKKAAKQGLLRTMAQKIAVLTPLFHHRLTPASR